MNGSSRTWILGISSGKGGAREALGQRQSGHRRGGNAGHDVGILDADVYGLSVPKMLGRD